MDRLEEVFRALVQLEKETVEGVTAAEIGKRLQIDRSTSSRYLNELVRENRAMKINGKPVRYRTAGKGASAFMGKYRVPVGKSLIPVLEKALAAVMYPGKPLPILITGETGTGKSYLAETLARILNESAGHSLARPFISFNCADYAHNPELLVGQIFGVAKGAYTGADTDKPGLVERADRGILFLDEIHRLPPSGQEMLFTLIDKGIYRRLGESSKERKANIALIGATTENPKTALLSTLYRRFTVKLHVPPLRERSREEREELVEQLLSEEAGKMKAPLAIVDRCKEIFLSCNFPGNIGQLKSEIQIACARAYLRYVKKETDRVIIREEDLSGDLLNFLKNEVQDEKKFGKVGEELPFPARTAGSPGIPNIYERVSKLLPGDSNPVPTDQIQQMIQDYVEELSRKYMKRERDMGKGWEQLIAPELLRALERAHEELRDSLPFYLNKSQFYVLGLHLQNYLDRKEQAHQELPKIIHPNVQYRKAARGIARVLNETIGMRLPEEEIELLAFFLAPEQRIGNISAPSIAVLLVNHGRSTASSMAEVANTLLGQPVIRAIDMPLDVTVQVTYERMKQEVSRMTGVKGILLLVDMGSLITLGDKLQHEFDIPIRTLSGVNLPMVLEAGRLSLISDMTLSEIYEKTKKSMFALSNGDDRTTTKKRMIATVCFTGEGAAQLLETWVKDQLSEIDRDVVVRTVRIDPVTKDTGLLQDLKNYYDMIAIIGTVPVSIEGVPFIPAWELLKTEGMNRLEKLLELTRRQSAIARQGDIERKEIPRLIEKGLREFVKYINPKLMTDILEEYMPPIARYFHWDVNWELGMWMHMGSFIERVVAAKIDKKLDTLFDSIPLNPKLQVKKEEKRVWEPLIEKLEKEFQIEIPGKVVDELIKLSR